MRRSQMVLMKSREFMMQIPARGEVWWVSLDPVSGHEQGSSKQGLPRPCVVISLDAYNAGPSGLVVVLPITTTSRQVEWWVAVDPPEGGLTRLSFVMCDQIRAVDYQERFTKRSGSLKSNTMLKIEDRLQILLDLYNAD